MKKIIFLIFLIPILLKSQSLPVDSNSTEIFSFINSFFDSLNHIHKTDRLDSVIRIIKNNNKFNGVILISQNSKIIFHKAFGYANYKTKTPLTTNSIFELASVSKQFTAVAILKLFQEGKLQLTDTIQKFIPAFPYKKRTIHHLLCHRSGLPDYYSFSSGSWKKQDSLMSNKDMVEIMCKRKPKAKFYAGKQFEYSNTGYVVLARIVEIISGKDFGVYVQENFFTPFGMKNSFIRTNEPKYLTNLKTVGHSSRKGIRKENFLNGCVGDKGVWSTPYDLHLWDEALFSYKILNDTILKMAITPKNADMSIEKNYGYGFRLGTLYKGINLVYHGGLWGGYNTLFIHRIPDNINIVVLSNVDNKSFKYQSIKWIGILEQL